MQLRTRMMRMCDAGRRLVRVGSVGLVLIVVVPVGCDSASQSHSATVPPTENDGSGAADVGLSDVQQGGAGGPTDSAAGAIDAAPDAPTVPSTDAVGTSEVADGGASDADGGGAGEPDADVARGNDGFAGEVAGPDTSDAGYDDVHVTVQPPSSHQPCACWPDGDDCDKFPIRDWQYVERPPCPENEVCTGDYWNPGTCQAKCDKPKPGQEVRFECHPTEKCVTIEMFDWEDDTKALEHLCVPK